MSMNPFAGKALYEALDVAHETLLDVAAKCPGRPSLPHEREEYGDVRWLTIAGQEKYDEQRELLSQAWVQAGLPEDKFPDPLVYA